MEKENLIEKAAIFPHVFKVLPIVDGKPLEKGTWAAYQNDESTIIWVNTSHNEAQKFYFEQLKNEEVYKMSKELTVNEDKIIKNLVAANMKAIKSILPKHITPERFARIAYTSIVSNPMLARCSQLSLINTIIEASTLGLEIGGAMREASLIPFKNNTAKTYEATLVVEYPGLIKLAKNTGEIQNISAHPVFENDDFRYNYGLHPDLIHVPSSGGEKGKLTYAYCIIWYINGGVDFEVVSSFEADLAKNKSAAKYKKDSPWNQEDNVPAMWVKTAIRRIMKRVPKASEQRFIKVDEMSGASMSHINPDSDIIDISIEDFHSINLSDGNDQDKNHSNQDPGKQNNKQKKSQPNKNPKLLKEVKNVMYLSEEYPVEFGKAVQILKIDTALPIAQYKKETAIAVYKKVNELMDQE
jgi:recombination protein RecT